MFPFPGFSGSSCCGGDGLCGFSAPLPRNQRTDLFQHTVMAIQAIFALAQQNLPRTAEAIYFAAVQLNPSETVSMETMNQALANGVTRGLFCLNECGYYQINVPNAQHKRNLKIYMPFIVMFNPCRVLYPQIVFP